jgi:hypothetical protein
MATLTKKGIVTGKASVQTKHLVTAKKVAPVQEAGFKVVDIDSIEFLPSSRGGGKPMDPATLRLISAALELEIGQGFKIPANMRVEREINGKNGKSTLYTYKGAVSLSKKAAANDMRFRTRRDVQQNLWLFRVEPLEVQEEVTEE